MFQLINFNLFLVLSNGEYWMRRDHLLRTCVAKSWVCWQSVRLNLRSGIFMAILNSLFFFGWIYYKEVCFGQLYFSLFESNLLYFIFSDCVFCFTFFLACFVSFAVFWNFYRLLSFVFLYLTSLSLSSISWSSLLLLSLSLSSLDFSFRFVFFLFFFNQIISHLRWFFLNLSVLFESSTISLVVVFLSSLAYSAGSFSIFFESRFTFSLIAFFFFFFLSSFALLSFASFSCFEELFLFRNSSSSSFVLFPILDIIFAEILVIDDGFFERVGEKAAVSFLSFIAIFFSFSFSCSTFSALEASVFTIWDFDVDGLRSGRY